MPQGARKEEPLTTQPLIGDPGNTPTCEPAISKSTGVRVNRVVPLSVLAFSSAQRHRGQGRLRALGEDGPPPPHSSPAAHMS